MPEGEEFARDPAAGATLVAGVRVDAPVTVRQAERLAPVGLLADTPASLFDVWTRDEAMWGATVVRARQLPAEPLDVRVGDGWSFVETLRHLVFVTDGWIRRLVEDQPAPHHPIGLPPHFIDGRALGLDLDARPTLDDVLEARRARMTDVRDLITRSTTSDLERACGDGFTVLGAIQVVIFEELAHHQYATRDLAQLEAR